MPLTILTVLTQKLPIDPRPRRNRHQPNDFGGCHARLEADHRFRSKCSNPMPRLRRVLRTAPHAPLAVVFVHGDFDAGWSNVRAPLNACQQALAEVPGQELGRRVAHGQDDAVAAGKNPAATVGSEGGFDFVLAGGDADQRMAVWQENVVVELVGDRLQFVAEGNEVDHVLVFIQRAFDFDRGAIVVAVQPLADIAIEGDEVRGAEDMLFFFEADAVSIVGKSFLSGTLLGLSTET